MKSASKSSPTPNETPARAPTSADIAKRVGVSRATVSYVLNGAPNARVSPATRAKILAAADELGYVPHALARSLRAGHSNTILFPQLDHPIAPAIGQFYEDLGTALRGRGYTLMIQLDPLARDVEAARKWASWRPAGILVEVDRMSPRAIKLLQTAGIPAVVVIGDTISPLVPSVLADQTEIGSAGAEFLAERGYMQLGAVVPREAGLQRLGIGRWHGVERVGAARGLQAHRFDMAFDEKEACDVARQLQTLASSIGILAYNDEYAALLLRAVQEVGLDVPKDVGLIGVGNRPICKVLRPRLTSIQNKSSENIEAIANLFDSLIQGNQVTTQVVSLFSPVIEARETT